MSLANYQKYEKYIDSGVDWIGDIPEGWEVRKLKYVCDLFNGDSISDGKKSNFEDVDENFSNPYIATKDINLSSSNIDYNNGLRIPKSLKGYKIAPKGSSLLCIEGGSAGKKIAFLEQNVCFVNKLACFRVKKNLSEKFIYYFLKTNCFSEQFTSSMSGLIGGVAISAINNFSAILPDVETQSRIADFLDQKTSEIDQAIEKKEKLINLLKEQKDIIIQKAVTQGLDPDVKMKDSKVDWIGEIPAHWELCKFRNLFKAVSVKNRPKLQLLSVVREKGIIVRDLEDQESNHNFVPEDLNGYKLVNKGQFVVNKMKAWQGSYGISSFQGIVSPAYYTFDVMKNMDKEFLNYAIRSKFYIPFFKSASDGVRIGQWDLSISRMKEISFIYPSQIEEQRQIVSFIKEAEKQIFELINSTELEIKKLKEFKQVLIANAVTGKIKI